MTPTDSTPAGLLVPNSARPNQSIRIPLPDGSLVGVMLQLSSSRVSCKNTGILCSMAVQEQSVYSSLAKSGRISRLGSRTRDPRINNEAVCGVGGIVGYCATMSRVVWIGKVAGHRDFFRRMKIVAQRTSVRSNTSSVVALIICLVCSIDKFAAPAIVDTDAPFITFSGRFVGILTISKPTIEKAPVVKSTSGATFFQRSFTIN